MWFHSADENHLEPWVLHVLHLSHVQLLEFIEHTLYPVFALLLILFLCQRTSLSLAGASAQFTCLSLTPPLLSVIPDPWPQEVILDSSPLLVLLPHTSLLTYS